MEFTLEVVSLLPNVDDKVDQVNLPQLFFFNFHFSFSVVFLLKKWNQSFLMCYSLYA